jgi:antitoxin component of MazEF toxin-antitoxin module
MAVKIGRHGNSLSLRLPAFIARSMKVQAGDYLSLRYLDDGSLRVVPVNEERIIPADQDSVGKSDTDTSKQDETEW